MVSVSGKRMAVTLKIVHPIQESVMVSKSLGIHPSNALEEYPDTRLRSLLSNFPASDRFSAPAAAVLRPAV